MLKYNLGNITVLVEDDYTEMSKVCARYLQHQVSIKPDSVIGLATGNTPEGTYNELVSMYKEGEINFEQVTTFNLDEYYPMLRTDKESYYYFMMSKLIDHINIDLKNVYIPNGDVKDPIKEAEEYERLIAKSGGLDLQLLGVGMNGHIGFNEPSDSFVKYTHLTPLQEDTRKSNSIYFETKDDVPLRAISMGIKTIMMAEKILFMASGERKSKVVKEALFGEITPHFPASIIQLHRDVTVVLDKAAAKDTLEQIGEVRVR